MKITDKLIDHLSDLSKLKFEGEERGQIRNNLEKITDFFSQLEEVNTKNIEPLKYINEETLNLRNDINKESISQKQALLNAPSKDSDYFLVPKVIKK